ncbi:hypothetical protein ACFHW2_13260 [Actinomadura sp. LOL_016]|uniref:hypothetical protein n=1 Tax=Actinomadura sp. LOL_016 TaxID=3345411 RepID=UPI003A8C614D
MAQARERHLRVVHGAAAGPGEADSAGPGEADSAGPGEADRAVPDLDAAAERVARRVVAALAG